MCRLTELAMEYVHPQLLCKVKRAASTALAMLFCVVVPFSCLSLDNSKPSKDVLLSNNHALTGFTANPASSCHVCPHSYCSKVVYPFVKVMPVCYPPTHTYVPACSKCWPVSVLQASATASWFDAARLPLRCSCMVALWCYYVWFLTLGLTSPPTTAGVAVVCSITVTAAAWATGIVLHAPALTLCAALAAFLHAYGILFPLTLYKFVNVAYAIHCYAWHFTVSSCIMPVVRRLDHIYLHASYIAGQTVFYIQAVVAQYVKPVAVNCYQRLANMLSGWLSKVSFAALLDDISLDNNSTGADNFDADMAYWDNRDAAGVVYVSLGNHNGAAVAGTGKECQVSRAAPAQQKEEIDNWMVVPGENVAEEWQRMFQMYL